MFQSECVVGQLFKFKCVLMYPPAFNKVQLLFHDILISFEKKVL